MISDQGGEMTQRSDRRPEDLDVAERGLAEGTLEPAQYDPDSGPGPRLMTASTLAGDDVVNAAGENLGRIEEIMLDVPRGRIAYAVMSFGGFLGMGSKL